MEALAFYKSNVSTDPAPVPDIELLFIGGSIRSDNGTGSKNLFRIPQAIYDKIWSPLGADTSFQVKVT